MKLSKNEPLWTYRKTVVKEKEVKKAAKEISELFLVEIKGKHYTVIIPKEVAEAIVCDILESVSVEIIK